MRIFAVVVAVALSGGLSGAVRTGTATESGKVIRDVPYSQDGNPMHLGDLYLPEKVTPGTQVLLAIHGGGWNHGDRKSWSGVAEFFRRELGFAVFNIEYRLRSPENPWPACGDDCVAAAKFLLGRDLADRCGLKVSRIWICGGSAGGHLTLWTALSLPANQVAGAISISGIGDPQPDFAVHGSRYRNMIGEGIPEMSPLSLIRGKGPRILQTHATGDKVVPIASAKRFHEAYRKAGSEAVFFEYPETVMPGLSGHCIWIPKSKPRRLIPAVEKAISDFVSETVLPVPDAPFPLEIRVWNPPERDFRIEDFGAQSGQVATRAVERAVAAANAAGGGRVKVSRGEWLCGAFELLDNVALVLEEGAVLRFPDDPLVITGRTVDSRGWPKLKFEGLVFAKDRRNVAILGPGTFKADTGFWERGYHANPKAGFPRPRFFRLEGCANVRMEDFKVRGSPRWTLHLVNCDDVLLRGVDSVCTGPNTDGLDLDACDRVLVDRCSLDQGDDAYTIKSGRREENRAVVRPCQNVFIRDSVAVHGHTLLGIGSECSGGVRNICMRNCRVTDSVWRFLRVKTNEKRGAFIENVTLEDVTGRRADNQVVEITMFYDGNPVKELTGGSSVAYPTRIKGVTVRNVRCEESPCAVRIEGDARLPPSDVLIENVRVGRLTGKKRLVKISNAPDAVVRDVIEGQ